MNYVGQPSRPLVKKGFRSEFLTISKPESNQPTVKLINLLLTNCCYHSQSAGFKLLHIVTNPSKLCKLFKSVTKKHNHRRNNQ